MVLSSHGNHLSRDFSLGKISQIGRDIGMITSKKRLERIRREARREVAKKNWLLSVKQGREKELFLERRVIVMEDHHI